MFSRAIFDMDRGYDDNKTFLKLDELNQDYVIRLTSKRKFFPWKMGFCNAASESGESLKFPTFSRE